MSVQRFTKERPCPICRGWDRMERGEGKRCHGYISSDRTYAHCAREDRAGIIEPRDTNLYAHRLAGKCKCGETHGEVVFGSRPDRTYHEYRTASGAPSYRVVREGSGADKKVWQEHWDGMSMSWLPRLNGAPLVPYRLPELLAADPTLPVYIAEGEKCCDALVSRGFVATCNPMGAKKWKGSLATEAAKALQGRHVVVLPDDDADGRAHRDQVVAALQGVAASVRVVELYSGDTKRDIYDWFAEGGTAEKLAELAGAAANDNKSEPTQSVSDLPPLAADVAALDTPPIRSYSTGNLQIDNLTGGINTRELMVPMGPPGGCKTAWAISTALHVQKSIPVLYASTELEQHELMARLAANLMGRPWAGIRRGTIARDVIVKALEGVNVYLIGCDVLPRDGDAAIAMIEDKGTRIAKKHGVPPTIFVDYLQDLARGSDREARARVGDIATSLRIMSQRLDCAVVAISSVARTFYSAKRAAEYREANDAAVYLAAAKESGDVDYAAARVLFLDAEDDREKPERAVRIAVAKSRDGRVGFAGARVVGETGRFFAAPEVLDEMGATGQAADRSEQQSEDDDEIMFKRVLKEHTRGNRELCTMTYLRDGNKGVGKTRAESALKRLVLHDRLRLVPIERVEGQKTKTREIYEPITEQP